MLTHKSLQTILIWINIQRNFCDHTRKILNHFVLTMNLLQAFFNRWKSRKVEEKRWIVVPLKPLPQKAGGLLYIIRSRFKKNQNKNPTEYRTPFILRDSLSKWLYIFIRKNNLNLLWNNMLYHHNMNSSFILLYSTCKSVTP